MPLPWPVPAVALAPVAIGTLVWRMAGVPRVTVVIKATFALVHGGAARLLPPRDLVREDRGHDGIPDEAAETAPFLPGAGVVLTGHAHAPGGRPAPSVAVRLGVYRERALLDKTLHVFGPRAAGSDAPQPFQKMPLGWDRACGGAGCDDNPVGVAAQPSILDPFAAQRPAGFGPIPPHWGPRQRLGSREAIQGGADASELPDGIDFRSFHAAPEDQQIGYLHGDEWIILDGLHPTLARVQTRLPGARAEARWHTPNGVARPVDLCADTLVIDADLRVCSLIWRGCFALEEAPERLRVVAGLALPEKPVAWPESVALGRAKPAPVEIAAVAPPQAPEAASAFLDESNVSTARVVLSRAQRAALPFHKITLADPEPRQPARLDSALPFHKQTLVDPEPQQPARPPTLPFPKQTLVDPEPRQPVRPNSALPFRPVEPPSVPPQGLVSAPYAEDELGDMTGKVDMRKVNALLAPFAVAEPGTRSATPAGPLPGAPWSGVPSSAAPPPVANSDESITLAPRAAPPGSTDLPPPALRPAEPGSAPYPGSTDLPPPAPRPAEPGSAPYPDTPPAPVTTEDSPKPAAPPAPVMMAAPPASVMMAAPPKPPPMPDRAPTGTQVRDKVIAALAAREALRGIDLQGADLRGVDLSRAALSGCKLAGADLRGCVLVEARLGDADLTGADLTDATLDGADLVRAVLSRATLTGASFAGALLTDADFGSARGARASFAGASGARPIFARGTWDGASFERLDVTVADFTAASLAGARFDGASLIELRLDDAQGEGASFDGAQMPGAHAETSAFPRASFKGAEAPGSMWDRATLDEAIFADANLEGADFGRAACPRASFAGARAVGANLARLTGDGADLRRAVLTGADLRGARLPQASCEGADLRNIQAQKVDLSRARLAGADLTGANLRSGKLTGAGLAGAVLDAADLRDADLERADVTGASRKGTKLNGANLKDLVGGGDGS